MASNPTTSPLPSEPDPVLPEETSPLLARLKALAPSPHVAKIILAVVRIVIAAAAVVFIYVRLSEIGWDATLAALP